MFVPRKRISPSTISAPGGSMPRMLRRVIDLPDPDSPTSPIGSPASRVIETSLRMRRRPTSPSMSTVRESTSRMGMLISSSPFLISSA